MIKTKDPFKKLELEDKVKACKANLTKLIRINKATHYNNYFVENKKNLLKTWDGIRVNKKSSEEINCLQVNNKTIADIKGIANEFKIHFTTVAKKNEKKLISSQCEFTYYLPQPNQDSIFLDPKTKEEIQREINTLKTNKSSGPCGIPRKVAKLLKTSLKVNPSH